MKTLYAINHPDADHLKVVKSEMEKLGAPEIRVVECIDYYVAIEGSHRLAAAAALGLTPTFIVIEQDETIDLATTDFDWEHDFDDQYCRAGDLAHELMWMQMPVYGQWAD